MNTEVDYDKVHNPIADLVRGNLKAALNPIKEGKSDIWKVPPSHLRVKKGHNPRIGGPKYDQEVRLLADRMKANGYDETKPIVVWVDDDGTTYVHDGHHRRDAALLAIAEGAEIATVPLVPVPKSWSSEDMVANLMDTQESTPFTQYEKAMIYARLANSGWTVQRLADRFLVSTTMVNNYLTIASAPLAIRELVAEGRISVEVAIEQMRTHGSKAAGLLTATVKDWSAKGVTKVTAKHLPGAARDKAVRRISPKVVSILDKARQSAEWNQVPQSIREQIEEFYVELQEAEKRTIEALTKPKANSEKSDHNDQD